MLHKYLKIIPMVLLPLALISCGSMGYTKYEQKTPQSQIRIVDLDGNPRQVKSYVPEYNAKVLASQGMEIDDKTGDLKPISGGTKSDVPIVTSPSVLASQASLSQNQSPSNINKTAAPVIAKNADKDNSGKGEVLIQETAKGEASQTAKENTNENSKEAVKESEVEYDLAAEGNKSEEAQEKINKSATKESTKDHKKFKIVAGKEGVKTKEPKTKDAIKPVKSGGKGGLFIQIGSFSSEKIAGEILNKNRKIAQGKIESANVNNKKFYRVMLGPISDQKKAEELLKKAENAGNKDAFITKNK